MGHAFQAYKCNFWIGQERCWEYDGQSKNYAKDFVPVEVHRSLFDNSSYKLNNIRVSVVLAFDVTSLNSTK